MELKSKMSSASGKTERKWNSHQPQQRANKIIEQPLNIPYTPPETPQKRSNRSLFQLQRLQFAVDDRSRPLQIEPEPTARHWQVAPLLFSIGSSQRILELIIISCNCLTMSNFSPCNCSEHLHFLIYSVFFSSTRHRAP